MPKYVTANPRKKLPSNTLEEILKKSIQLNQEPWVRACIIILWLYGIRIGELEKVKKRDFTQIGVHLYLDSVPSKNPSEPYRDIPLNLDSAFMDTLIEYLSTLDPDSRVLVMTTKTFKRRLKAIDPELSPHVFRHWRGTRLPFQTDNPYEIMGFMGHSDIRTAIKYQHESGVLAERLGKKLVIK